MTTDKQSQAAELSDSTRLREVRVANQLLSDEEKASVKYDHRFDGAFTDALMIHPILGDTCHPLSSFFLFFLMCERSHFGEWCWLAAGEDGEIKGLVQIRNKAPPAKKGTWGWAKRKMLTKGNTPFSHADELFVSWCLDSQLQEFVDTVQDKT